MNSTLRSLFGSKVAAAVNESQTLASVEHAGVRSRLKEIPVQELIRPLYTTYLGGYDRITDRSRRC